MNTTIQTRRNLAVTRKESGVAILLLDCSGKFNTLTTEVMKELREALHLLQADPLIKAAVFISGKPDTFVIGADLFEIRQSNAEKLEQLARDGQSTLNDGINSTKPIVVAINGTCLGGGLELAMAGHWRVATDLPNTRLGLPETRLGLIPGLGGTQRLPRLVGLKQAVTMILSAEPISAQEALACGLIDELVSADHLLGTAEKRALELANNPDRIIARRELLGTANSGTGQWPIADLDKEKANKFFAMTERSLRIRTKGNYPAQTRVVDVIKTGLYEGIESGLKLELKTFVELAATETFANLLALFFQTDFAKQSAAALAAKFGQTDTRQIGIIGGGTMGGSIARLSAEHSATATVKVKSTSQMLGKNETNIAYTDNYADLSSSQLVLECIAENMAAKQSVLKDIESCVSEDCVIASNTSALSLGELSTALAKPDRFVGLHFFQPVDRMQLVEIVSLKGSGRRALARAADFVTRLGKIPLMVKDGPGFLINRLLSCYLMSAARLLEEGTPLNLIDEAAVSFGMPIGPFELLDEVGLELAYTIANTLHAALGARLEPPPIFENIPRLRLQGKRQGAGIYLYDQSGKRTGVNPQIEAIPGVVVSASATGDSERQTLIHRLMFPMVDEAARCLEERIVMKPREIDMAIVYSIGFPPFRGGLLKYADSVGLNVVAENIEDARRKHDDPREVCSLINKYLNESRGFYSRAGKEDEQ